MADFLEIKQLLGRIVGCRGTIDDTNNIVFSLPSYNGYDASGMTTSSITFSNDALESSYNRIQSAKSDKLKNLELSVESSRREVVIAIPSHRYIDEQIEPLNDPVNHLTYSIGVASFDYCIFLLDRICESKNKLDHKAYRRLMMQLNPRYSRLMRNINELDTPEKVLSRLLNIYTLTTSSTTPTSLDRLRKCASAYEFLFMYKKSVPIFEYTSIEDMYLRNNSAMTVAPDEFNSPPLRLYDAEVLEYYTMGMESRDPFTAYISFYHVIEHYFDAVFKTGLTKAIRKKITNANFSYKDEDCLYALANYIKKHMKGDDESGKGNEKDSLGYVLEEYVDIDELKARITVLSEKAVSYYQETSVPFITSPDKANRTKINWQNSDGVYTNLATRIYETRNALVHSKSEQSSSQYRPYKDKKSLLSELPLIRAVAELVISNSSSEL